MIDAGCLCFDIGAHHGETAQRFLDLGAGSVVSVEACWQNHLVLATRFADDTRVVPMHAAASDEQGIKAISRSKDQSGLSTMHPSAWAELYPGIRFERPEIVPSITLATLGDRFGRPHLLKVDVEGHEFAVLKGMDFRPSFITFEFHRTFIDIAIACVELLIERGFTVGEIYASEPDWTQRPGVNLGEILRELQTAPPEWGNISVG